MSPLFRSFYMAGFECATGRNVHGEWIDQIRATEHDDRADGDYALLRGIGIECVREAVRWPLVDRAGCYDFSSLAPFIAAAKQRRMQVIWDLFHYGYPEELDPFSAQFAQRFARYAQAAAHHVREQLPGPHFFTPINEASYFAWAAGEVGHFGPHQIGRGHELKLSLARAALLGIDAIRAVCPKARFVTVDPLCHVVPPLEASKSELRRVEEFNRDVVFQFLDIVAGRSMPELGGDQSCLDIVGINYYASNQWELDHPERPLSPTDPRKRQLADLVKDVAWRYGRPVLISETAGLGAAREDWLDQLSDTAVQLLEAGVPLVGVCLYPVLGMPEWHDRERWARMGLWDLEPGPKGLERCPSLPVLGALERAQAAMEALCVSQRSTAAPLAQARR